MNENSNIIVAFLESNFLTDHLSSRNSANVSDRVNASPGNSRDCQFVLHAAFTMRISREARIVVFRVRFLWR